MVDKHDTPRTLKRRGILAAAGAVVAGIVAKQASLPVVAGATGGTNGTALILGANYADGTANTSTATTQIFHNGGTVGSYYVADAFVAAASDGGTGVQGKSSAGGIGVYGTVYPDTADATGVYGSVTAGTGVYGISSGNGLSKAVYGHHTSNGYGVYGDAGTGGFGVTGVATTALGVLGQSTSGVGVEGFIAATSTAANTIAVFGNNLATGANSIGIYGSCANGTGIYGQTSASYQYGVLGTTYAANSTAIAGTCTGNGSSAFSGGTGNPNAFAAYFQGHVQIDGPFDVIGAGNKHAAVAHPDGTHRTIYSVESPEAWVEDFGTGTLTAGKADIKLDADFAALIHTDTYHVFLAGIDEHLHLITKGKSASGFTVEADTALAALKGKKVAELAGTFSWRVVARPKTSAKVGRLAKVTIADAKALLPDPAKLPKPPEAPKATAPRKP